jgi:hypothetical protein
MRIKRINQLSYICNEKIVRVLKAVIFAVNRLF